MILGFTGTRRGMTPAQRRACATLLGRHRPAAVHHGDAIGADREFHDLARALGTRTRIIVHPPTHGTHRAFCAGDIVHRPKSKTTRDRDVVDACDLLVATPAAPDLDGPDSGTWYTIQYAVWRAKPIVLIWPDGTREYGERATRR